MRNIIIFDDNETRRQLLPLTHTRPIAKIRIGVTTIAEKWQNMLGEARYSWLTASYLQEKFPLLAEGTNLMIAGHVLPSPTLAKQALALGEGEAIIDGEQVIAFNGKPEDFDNRQFTKTHAPAERPASINKLYDIFELNSKAICDDFALITQGRKSQPIPDTATVIGDASQIF
ncbi:MAG: glucose-1-phosphate thymidylyltransferase, partial [Bacteroidales bacterium]|nr:glucose-1-phosphate thymidylyltransferase [Bacteroidales bacterium]